MCLREQACCVGVPQANTPTRCKLPKPNVFGRIEQDALGTSPKRTGATYASPLRAAGSRSSSTRARPPPRAWLPRPRPNAAAAAAFHWALAPGNIHSTCNNALSGAWSGLLMLYRQPETCARRARPCCPLHTDRALPWRYKTIHEAVTLTARAWCNRTLCVTSLEPLRRLAQ